MSQDSCEEQINPTLGEYTSMLHSGEDEPYRGLAQSRPQGRAKSRRRAGRAARLDQDCPQQLCSIQAGTCRSMLAPLCELGFRQVFRRDVCDETIEKGMDQDSSGAAVALLMDTRTLGPLDSVLVAASSGAAGMLPFSHFTEFNTPRTALKELLLLLELGLSTPA